jgi:hypothetical protein
MKGVLSLTILVINLLEEVSYKYNEDIDNSYQRSSIVFGNIYYEPLKRVSYIYYLTLVIIEDLFKRTFQGSCYISRNFFQIFEITDLPNISIEPNNSLISSGIPIQSSLQKIQSFMLEIRYR